MALLETQSEHLTQPENPSNNNIVTECYPLETSGSTRTIRSLGSARSLRSIKSLRDISLVNASYDGDYDTVLSERRGNLSAAYLSSGNASPANPRGQYNVPSPIYPAVGTSSPRSNGPLDSPWLDRCSGRIRNKSREDGASLEQFFSDANETIEQENTTNDYGIGQNNVIIVNSLLVKDGVREEPALPEKLQTSDQHALMEEIAKCAGALASMKDFLETWAPTAHRVVTTAAALQRDSAAFAASLRSLLSYDGTCDPVNFANQYYQLREAYSSLLCPCDFSTATYSQQDLKRESHIKPNANKHPYRNRYGPQERNIHGEVMETAWDDRQLVDSLMTLLRTSPGFIASAISQMSQDELESFCSEFDDDKSPLNVLFYGILGTAKRNRPRVLAEVLKTLDHLLSRNVHARVNKTHTLSTALLFRFTGLVIGNTSAHTQEKLNRFFRICLDARNHKFPDFTPILSSVLPDELVIFCQGVFQSESIGSQFGSILIHHLQMFARQLLTRPHHYGILQDVYLSNRLKEYLHSIATRIMPSITKFVESLKENSPKSGYIAEYWQHNELIAVKGSDIVLLYNSLLPKRDETGFANEHSRPISTASTNSSSTHDCSGTDEWCLDSIREDLVPVMQGLSHSIRMRVDGWQIFKVGEDGLVTDLGSDMGLSSEENHGTVTPQVQALCDAVAHLDGVTVTERVENARRDAELRGDHLTLLDLQNAESLLTSEHVLEMSENVSQAKARCKSLRRMLDQAAQDQRHERERLSNLVVILDCARVHVWYETEARNSHAFFKAREFLQVLYPKSKVEDDEKYAFSTDGDSGLTSYGLGFSFGIGTNGFNSLNGTKSLNNSGNGSLHGEQFSVPGGALVSDSSAPPANRSRRLSILSSHSSPDPPFFSKPMFKPGKLTDKEVEVVLMFMRRNRARNILQAEETFTRGLIEIANVARKLVDRDSLVSYMSFKRDRHYQTQYAQQLAGSQRTPNNGSSNVNNGSKRGSHHHRRSSLGLFDFFDTSSHQPSMQLTLHTTTSTQFLGLTSSHDSLRGVASTPSHHDDLRKAGEKSSYSGTTNEERALGPPRPPTIAQVQALILSDIGRGFMTYGTETDSYMQQTGRMLLEGDSQELQPLLDDISMAGSPINKLHALEKLVEFVFNMKQRSQRSIVSRSEIIQQLSNVIGREPGTIYRDLQVISVLVNPVILNRSEAFEDCVEAAHIVIDTVVMRSMDYAARFLRYYMESTMTAAPKMALMGINDSVAIWAFCARQGHREAQEKLAELYLKFSHLELELKPLVKPSTVVDGLDGTALREAVALHWMTLASRI